MRATGAAGRRPRLVAVTTSAPDGPVTTAAGGASPVEAVDRALRVLQALAASGAAGAPLGDLARGLGLSKATVHRTLAALRHRAFVTQDPSSGAYALGPAVVELAERWLGEENLPALLHPALVALARATDELVHLGVLSGADVVYLDKVEPERPVRVWSAVGRRVPAVRTALGRAVLAARGTDRAMLAGYVGDSASTDDVWAALEAARQRGFATEREEN